MINENLFEDKDENILFVLDGGCSAHQTNDINDLTHVEKYYCKVKLANGEHLHTKAKGRIGCIINVSFTPGIKKLLSEIQLIKQGYSIVKNNIKYADILCKVSGELKGRAFSKRSGLWYINPREILPINKEILDDNPDFAYSASVPNENTYEHFDNILFMSQNSMKKLKLSKAVIGFNVSMKEIEMYRPANQSRILASMTKSSVHHKPNYEKEKPKIGQVIIADLYGPTRTKGLSGQKYHAYFIDKGGGVNGVYPLNSKSDAFEKFKKFYAYKKSIGDNITELQCGEDGELNSREFKSWLRERGIYLNTAAPYKHEHTAQINTHIRHNNNLTRAML